MSSCLIYDALEQSKNKVNEINDNSVLSQLMLLLNGDFLNGLSIHSKIHDNCFDKIISRLETINSTIESCNDRAQTLSTGLETIITSYKKAESETGKIDEQKLLGSEDFRGGVSIFGNDKATQSVSDGKVNRRNLSTSKDEFDKNASDEEKQMLEDKQNSYIPIADRTEEDSDITEEDNSNDKIFEDSDTETATGTATIMGATGGAAVMSAGSPSASSTNKNQKSEAKLKTDKDSKKAKEEVKKQAEEEAKKKAEEEAEAKQRAEEEARQKAEEEAKQKAEEEAKQKAEEEAKQKAEEEAKQKAEEEAKKKAEEQQKQSESNNNNKTDENVSKPGSPITSSGTSSSGSDNYHTGGGYSSSGEYTSATDTTVGEEAVADTNVSDSTIEVLDESPTSVEDVIKDNYTKIPSSSEPITSSSSKGKGTIIPVIAGLSAAAAAGIGAKAYLDRKENKQNEETDDIETENWSGEDTLDLEYDDDKVPVAYLDDDDDDENEESSENTELQPEKYDARSKEELADLQ